MTFAHANLSLMKITLFETKPPKSAQVESYSPFCLKVHRALKAAGLPYDCESADNPASFKSMNPAGTVPILKVEQRIIADSTPIVAEVAKLSGRLVPEDAKAAALAWLWEDYADTALNGYLVAARWADADNWKRTRAAYFEGAPWFVQNLIVPRIRARVLGNLQARDVTRAGLAQTWANFERILEGLESAAPTQGFWVGPTLSVADVSIFGQLQSFRTDLTPGQRARVEKRAVLTAYLDRVDTSTRASAAIGGS
jgi:glutathione S-transferase